jgi:transcriptional regulator with XRE-family HTH domain
MQIKNSDTHQDSLATPTPAQLRAARALLGWSRAEAAQRFEVGVNTMARLETGEEITARTLRHILQSLESAGVEFLSEPDRQGVWLRQK